MSGAATPFWNGIATPPLREQRRELRRHGLHIPQLDAKHHDVAGADLREVVGEARRANGRVAEAAFDDESAVAQRGEMPAARDERHVVARLRELAAEITADAAGADHRDTHGPALRECTPQPSPARGRGSASMADQ